jgi:phage N-6-adenine-methyltransferase
MPASVLAPIIEQHAGDERLPALIDRAQQRLIAARSSAEVLEAKGLAEAALHYAKVTKAANDTHADCLRIIVRAEIRMADEIDAGQECGAVASAGGDPIVRRLDNGPTTLAELGVDRRRLEEWRETRNAGMYFVESVIGDVLADGRTPTKADIQRAIKGDPKPHVSHNSGENEWYTPIEIIEAARSVLGRIDLDPASSKAANKVVKAKRFYTAADNGLEKPWRGRVWMNPPYAQPLVSQFADRLATGVREGHVPAAMVLVNNATETEWFGMLAEVASAICFPNGRVKFWSPTRETTAPLQGQAVLYVGRQVARFTKHFRSFGLLVTVQR